MVTATTLVPIIALVISLGGILFQVLGFRQKAASNYVDELRGMLDLNSSQIKNLQERMAACERAREDLAKTNEQLTQQNVDLLRRIVEEGVIKQLGKN